MARFGGIPVDEEPGMLPLGSPEAVPGPVVRDTRQPLPEPPVQMQPKPKASGGRFGGIPIEPTEDPANQPVSAGRGDTRRGLGNRPPPEPDQWALDNPEQDQLLRMEGARRNAERDDSNPGSAGIERRLTLAGDSMTMGVMQKLQGIRARLQGKDPEEAERLWKYELEEMRKSVPEGLVWELLGGIMTPGGGGGILKGGAEAAAQTVADTAMRNTPSQTGEGMVESAVGGAVIGGGMNAAGRAIASNPPAPEPAPVTGVREQAGTNFRDAATGDFNALKDTKKAALEKTITDGNVSFKENAGPRLEYHVRSNIADDIASLPANQGLSTNINEQVTPGAWEVLRPNDGILAQVAGGSPDTMSLRELDNAMRRINRIRPANPADEVALGAIKKRFESFSDIAEVDMLTNIPKSVMDGDPAAVQAWKAANKDMAGYLSIQQGTAGAKRLLRNVIENQDLTGVDLARISFGSARIAEGVKATGMVDTLEEVFGRDSEVFRAYQEGMLAVLGEGSPSQIAKRVGRFLDENQELASSIFDPAQLSKLQTLQSESAVRATTKQGRAYGGSRGQRSPTTDLLVGYMFGGTTGAAVAGGLRAAGTVVGRDKPLNQAIRSGLEGSAGSVARQAGEPTGEFVMPQLQNARDAVINNLRGAQ